MLLHFVCDNLRNLRENMGG